MLVITSVFLSWVVCSAAATDENATEGSISESLLCLPADLPTKDYPALERMPSLGIVKQADSAEPEDHAGALCEVMTLLSAEPDDASRAEQMEFFRQHIAPWMPAFFGDLQAAKNAGFYRAVARFGDSLLETESEYFKYGTEHPSAAREGGRQDED